MRNLNNSDFFQVLRIIRKTDFKSRLLKLDLPRDEQGNVLLKDSEYFVVLIMELLEGAPEAEDDIFKFLGSVAGVSAKKMKEDEFDLLLDVMEHLKGQDKLVTFLERAFKLMD